MNTYFLHGLGQTAQAWNEVTSCLPELDAECVELITDEVNYPDVFANIEKSFSTSNGKLRLCEISLGAILAIDYTIHHQNQVESLILIGAQYKIPTALINFQNLIFKCLPKRAFENSGLSKESMISLASSMRKLDFTQDLSKISCPVAVVCGEKDRANRKASKELSEKLSNAKLYIVPKCSHEVNVWKPDAVVSIITERWLSQGKRDCT